MSAGCSERAPDAEVAPDADVAAPPTTRIAGPGEEIEALLPASSPRLEALRESLGGESPWEVELGFGKGRYLLRRAAEDPAVRFLGVEMVGEYFRLAARRRARRGLDNLTLLQGDALYLLASVLPRGFASAVHAYFPDPWPKAKHHRRRLYGADTFDLVLGLLRPGGRFYFASDHPSYGPEVAELLEGRRELQVARRQRPWDDGARTNYEAKYVAEGRAIVRVEGTLIAPVGAPGRSVVCAAG